MKRLSAAIVALCLCLASAPSGRAGESSPRTPTPAELGAVLGDAFTAWNVPGAAVAVVKDGEVVALQGFGVTSLEDRTPVDADTAFYVASVTKGFTAAALGILVGEGRLNPDARVSGLDPLFGSGDAEQMKTLTVRDLLAHRTGFPRADMLMFAGLSDEEVIGRMGRLAPVAGLRERFTYQNQMYLELGRLVSMTGGGAFSDVLEERLLEPLGMTASNADGLGHADGTGAARPHGLIGGRVVPLEFQPRAPTGAGAVNSTARDMANWVRFQMSGGEWRGSRIMPAPVAAAMQAPQTIVQPSFFAPDSEFLLYGLGWFMSDYEGTRIVQHGGNGEGWTSLVWFMPEHQLGVVVLTNMNSSLLPYAMAYTVAHAYGLSPRDDWVRHFRDMEARRDAAAASRKPNPDGRPLADGWAGVWRNPVYGDLTVRLEGAGGALRYGPALGARLQSVGENAALVTWDRTDLAAVLDGSTASLSTADGKARLVLTVGGDRIGFERLQ